MANKVQQPTSEYGQDLVKRQREKEIETSLKYSWDNMTRHVSVVRVGEPLPLPPSSNPNAQGSLSTNSQVPVKLPDGIYDLTNVVLTRNFIDHLIENKIQPMPGMSQYEMRGIDAAPMSEGWWQTIGRYLNPKNLEQVTNLPLRVQIETADGRTHIHTLLLPKNKEEYTVVMQALMDLYKQQGIRRLVLDFPGCKNAKDIDLDRVMIMLRLAQASVPPVAIRLSSNILKRLAMNPGNAEEKALMTEIRKIESELKEAVKKDSEVEPLKAKAAQEFLTGDMKTNKAELEKAHEELQTLMRQPASNDKLKEGINKLQEAISKVEDNMRAIEFEFDTRKISNDIAKEYKQVLDDAKSTLTAAGPGTLASTANDPTLLNHVDAAVKAAAEGLQKETQTTTKVNESLLTKIQTQIAPHDEKADILLADHTTKLQDYEAAANVVLAALEANPPVAVTPVQIQALDAALNALNQSSDAIKQEIDVITQEHDTDVLRDKYADHMNNASWNVTDTINERFEALGNPVPNMDAAVRGKVDDINTKTLDIDGAINNELQAAAARP